MRQPDTQQVNPQLERELQSLLRSSEQQLTHESERQLSHARQAALAGQVRSHSFFVWPKLAVAMATIVAITVLMAPMFDGSSVNELPDENVLALDDELYQDLEFYQWLVETDAIDGHNG